MTSKEKRCPNCVGSGTVTGRKKCFSCNGKGFRYRSWDRSDGKTTCSSCGGRGSVMAHLTCGRCRGRGKV